MDTYPEEPSEDRFLQHLSRSSHEDYASSYFKPKRADRLLAENTKFERYDKRESSASLGTRPKLGFLSTGGSSGRLNNNASPGSGGSIGGMPAMDLLDWNHYTCRGKDKRRKRNIGI